MRDSRIFHDKWYAGTGMVVLGQSNECARCFLFQSLTVARGPDAQRLREAAAALLVSVSVFIIARKVGFRRIPLLAVQAGLRNIHFFLFFFFSSLYHSRLVGEWCAATRG